MANTGRIPAEIKTEIRKSVFMEGTGLFDTHPATKDRIARARLAKTPGLFRVALPAAVIFRDFPRLSKETTLDLYRELLGKKVGPEKLISASELRRDVDEREAGVSAVRRYFQDQFSLLRPLPLPEGRLGPPADVEKSIRIVTGARQGMLKALAGYTASFKRYDELDDRLLEAHQAEAQLGAALRIDPGEFHLRQSSDAAARSARKEALSGQEALRAELEPFEKLAVARLLSALKLLWVPAVAQKVEGAEALRGEVAALLPAGAFTSRAMPRLVEFRNGNIAMASLLARLEDNQGNETLIKEIRRRMRLVRDELKEVCGELEGQPYPFSHAEGEVSLGRYAAPEMPGIDDPGEIFGAGDGMINRSFSTYLRLVGRLVLAAEAVEKALGMPPLKEPPEERPAPDGAG